MNGLASICNAARATILELESSEVPTTGLVGDWSPERFAREQIRRLVRQLFSFSAVPPIRQVVFSAVGQDSDVPGICRSVGRVLAEERFEDVALAGGCAEPRGDGHNLPLKQIATRMQRNLWLLPPVWCAEENIGSASLHKYLGVIRAEFEYSILAGPPAGESDEAMAMAQFADGIVLVLSARNTRRATARKVKQTLVEARVRLLGTVLSDREFPIPEALYRHL